MKETVNMATQKIEGKNGLVPGVAHLALDVVDRSQSLAIAVLHDARAEIRAVVDSAIELAEKTTAATFRFSKKLVQRVDDGIGETLTSAEKLIGGAVRSARETTKAATELAQTATQGLAGERVAASA
ncbi:MAG TPA: hypothetical protein VGL61_36965 [Kofleriaceae bacterium]|jgi:hypothetical protein